MIDLHIHTTASDGVFDASTILDMAEEIGIEVISFTDHDSVGAYDNKEIFMNRKCKVISGVELTVVHNGNLIEILGYGMDIDKIRESKWLNKQVKVQFQEEQIEHLKTVCDRLGIIHTDGLVLNHEGFANNTIFFDIIKYSENNEILEKMGILTPKKMFREHCCNKKSPFYIDDTKYRPDIKEGSELIRNAGGKVFYAHPFGVYSFDNPEEVVDEIVNLKLVDGIECMHIRINEKQSDYSINLCNEKGLYKSGGSDFHRPTRRLGDVCMGTMQIPNELIEEWYEI